MPQKISVLQETVVKIREYLKTALKTISHRFANYLTYRFTSYSDAGDRVLENEDLFQAGGEKVVTAKPAESC